MNQSLVQSNHGSNHDLSASPPMHPIHSKDRYLIYTRCPSLQQAQLKLFASRNDTAHSHLSHKSTPYIHLSIDRHPSHPYQPPNIQPFQGSHVNFHHTLSPHYSQITSAAR